MLGHFQIIKFYLIHCGNSEKPHWWKKLQLYFPPIVFSLIHSDDTDDSYSGYLF